MLNKSDEYTWKRAKKHFSNQTLNQDVVYKLHRHTSPYWRTQYTAPTVTHSFIHLNGTLYELMPGNPKRQGKIAGKGGFSRVKYIYDENGKKYTVKIDLYKGACLDKNSLPSLETRISKDVGLFLNVGYRTKPKSLNRTNEKYFRYAVMEDLGTDLSTYLIYNDKLDDKTRLDLCFQACFLIYQLHSGLMSHSDRPIAHRDIKPLNFLYDEKTNKLSLGDFGLSQYGPIDAPPPALDGTDSYLPYINIHQDISAQRKKLKMHELDVFALKRSLYYPKITKTTDRGLHASTYLSGILNDTQLDFYHLRPYFETRMGDGDYHSPLLLSAVSLMARYDLQSYIFNVASDEALQKAIIVLHFAKMMSDSNYQTLLKNPTLTNDIAALLPVAHLIKPTHLSETLNSPKLYSLLLDISALPYTKKIDFAEKFNQIDLTKEDDIKPTEPTPNIPQPHISVPVTKLNQVLIDLIYLNLDKAEAKETDILQTIQYQTTFSTIESTYQSFLDALDEKDYAYFLLILNRQLKQAQTDNKITTQLTSDALQCLARCQQLTETKLLAPLATPMDIVLAPEEAKVETDLAFNECRDLFFTILKNRLSTTEPLSQHTIYKADIEKLIHQLSTAKTFDLFSRTLEKTLSEIKDKHFELLIYINSDLHSALVMYDQVKQLSEKALSYFEQVRQIVDHCDDDFYARHSNLPQATPS